MAHGVDIATGTGDMVSGDCSRTNDSVRLVGYGFLLRNGGDSSVEIADRGMGAEFLAVAPARKFPSGCFLCAGPSLRIRN
jgi:hypothetical protein